MKPFVLDASVALAWFFEDENSSAADRVLDLLGVSEAVVPVIWPIEVGHALLAGERRKRIKPAETARALNQLRSLYIRVEDSPLKVDRLVDLARSEKLSVYDATYLSLAMREGLPLATLDRTLERAAEAVGVTLLEL